MSIDALRDRSVKELQRKIDALTESTMNGGHKTLDEYRYACGQWRALNECIRTLNEEYRQLVGGEK